ncbi:MAG: heavy-metal-associated domain-containing protein, partial [Candidatus Poseidoniaceae archaeon]
MASIDVDGMTCAVCVSRVESVILELDGISNVAVNLARGSANFSGTVDMETVIDAVNNSGYKASMPTNYFEKWISENEISKREIKISSISLIYSLFAMYYIMTAENDQ